MEGTWRRAKDELIAHVTEYVTQRAAVQAILVQTVTSAPFKKKLKAATLVVVELILKGDKTFPPMGGMGAEAQRGILAVAGHVAWAETYHPARSLFATRPSDGTGLISKLRQRTMKRMWIRTLPGSCFDRSREGRPWILLGGETDITVRCCLLAAPHRARPRGGSRLHNGLWTRLSPNM